MTKVNKGALLQKSKPFNQSRPNPADVKVLLENCITPPESRSACHSLAKFILHGNLVMGGTPLRRALYTRDMQAKWVGKTVRRSIDQKLYEVVALIPVRFGGAMRTSDGQTVQIPFKAILRGLESKAGGTFSLVTLEIVK